MLLFHAMLTLLLLLVIYFDATHYIIPNWLVGTIILLYPAMLMLAPPPETVDWRMSLPAMGLVFAVGYIVFIMRWMGGGDIKLLTALALWVGMNTLFEFLLAVAVLGGGLALILLIGRPIALQIASRRMPPVILPRLLNIGEPVPYGIAVAIAFIAMMYMGKVESLPVS